MKPIVETSLFIGGPANGSRRTVLHGNKVRVVTEYRPSHVALTESGPELGGGAKVVEYRAEQIRGENVSFLIWVAEDVTIDQALAALFEHYKP